MLNFNTENRPTLTYCTVQKIGPPLPFVQYRKSALLLHMYELQYIYCTYASSTTYEWIFVCTHVCTYLYTCSPARPFHVHGLPTCIHGHLHMHAILYMHALLHEHGHLNTPGLLPINMQFSTCPDFSPLICSFPHARTSHH